MHEKDLFEYAVIRVVPKVEREEFLNIGIILYCPKQKFLRTSFLLDKNRLNAFAGVLNMEELHEHLCSFERICAGDDNGGPIAKLDIASRFRWLTATRSTIIQSSKVHPGFCVNASETLEKLFNQLVV
jgi:hypothetical protein